MSSTGNACKVGTEEKCNWGHGNQQVSTKVEWGHGFMVHKNVWHVNHGVLVYYNAFLEMGR